MENYSGMYGYCLMMPCGTETIYICQLNLQKCLLCLLFLCLASPPLCQGLDKNSWAWESVFLCCWNHGLVGSRALFPQACFIFQTLILPFSLCFSFSLRSRYRPWELEDGVGRREWPGVGNFLRWGAVAHGRLSEEQREQTHLCGGEVLLLCVIRLSLSLRSLRAF